jgi:hypothetical protein
MSTPTGCPSFGTGYATGDPCPLPGKDRGSRMSSSNWSRRVCWAPEVTKTPVPHMSQAMFAERATANDRQNTPSALARKRPRPAHLGGLAPSGSAAREPATEVWFSYWALLRRRLDSNRTAPVNTKATTKTRPHEMLAPVNGREPPVCALGSVGGTLVGGYCARATDAVTTTVVAAKPRDIAIRFTSILPVCSGPSIPPYGGNPQGGNDQLFLVLWT